MTMSTANKSTPIDTALPAAPLPMIPIESQISLLSVPHGSYYGTPWSLAHVFYQHQPAFAHTKTTFCAQRPLP